VALFFLLWVATMSLVIFSPSTLNTLFIMAQQVSGWVFVITIAIVGAIFIGMFISHRLLTHGGFTPFEEEMLRMRQEVTESREHLKRLRDEVGVLRVEVSRVRRGTHGAAAGSRAGAGAGALDDELTAATGDLGQDAAEVGR
jgi:hypothetical protein